MRKILLIAAAPLALAACAEGDPGFGLVSVNKASLMAQVEEMAGFSAEQQCQIFALAKQRAPELVAQAEAVLDDEGVACVTPDGAPL